MTLPDRVASLIETFGRNIESYRQGPYNEAQVRKEFIDPFFKELGWDMDNERGHAEAYKDVIHEDAIRVGGATKAPDYCFRVGGTRKFFLEAKKPSVNIKDDPSPAYQLRRYAWSAKLPLSILTDFEEFAVYDCRVRPHKNDKPAKARILYFTYDEYAERWDEIASRFTRDAVLKGSFDKYAQAKRKRGTAEVDAAFLGEIEVWRDTLARNIALRNANLSNRELNFAVQRTIDRIIFLRICEDRGIEPYKQLEGVTNGIDVYPRLVALFRRADDRYNSGLFHFMREKDRTEGPDELTPDLVIDDKPLKGILHSLYYPDSPYEFSVLPAEILGHVYEQFLGKVITLTAGHRAKVEDKPEVKKAGGVYYTPSYIVDYIVEHTVGKLLEERRVEVTQVSRGRGKKRLRVPAMDRPLRILDPACGSGSFLLGAYQVLLNWYRDYYSDNDPQAWAKFEEPPIACATDGSWKLTTAERKRILLDHIYGVDIDTQAVEVTKLSLLLRVLEGEKNLVLFHNERALPDLASNIKCGNSLIGPDFYESQPFATFDEEERFRINAFDWHTEFPHIFKDGGFDAVIGNPPYVRQEGIVDSKDYYRGRYSSYCGGADLYVYFVERSLASLKQGGYFSFIIANKWLRTEYASRLRSLLLGHEIEELVDFGDLPVFRGATAYPCILRIRQSSPASTFTFSPVKTLDFLNLSDEVTRSKCLIQTSELSSGAWTLCDPKTAKLLDKMSSFTITLGAYLGKDVYRGLLTGKDDVFVIDRTTRDQLISQDARSAEVLKPYIVGKDVHRYEPPTSSRYVMFTRRGISIEKYPAILEYLREHRASIAPRPVDWKGSTWEGRKPGAYKWYEIQDAIDYYAEFEKPKLVYLKFQVRPAFTYDVHGVYPNSALWIIPSPDLYLLGILNSKVGWFLVSQFCTRIQNGYQLIYKYLHQIPVPSPSSACCEPARHDQMVELVEGMLQLHAGLAAAKTPDEKKTLQRQIDATDRQIDQLVYELYGLTDDEIKIVEEATR